MLETRETLAMVGQLAGFVAAALILPGALIDLAFGTHLLDILLQAMLGAFAVALVFAVWRTRKQDS